MTESLFNGYMEKIGKQRPGGIFNPSSLLLMDQAKSHKISAAEKIKNMRSLLLPAGCTSLVKPLDVSVNKLVKCHMRRIWKEWMCLPEEQHLLTKNRKRQRVSETKIKLHY